MAKTHRQPILRRLFTLSGRVLARLRRSPDGVCLVKNALSAFFTRHTPSFARRSRASTRPERVKSLLSIGCLCVFAMIFVLPAATLAAAPGASYQHRALADFPTVDPDY